MPQVLFVHSSPPSGEVKKISQGYSTRQMARVLKSRIKGRCVRIIDRDIAAEPPGMVDRDFVNAANATEETRTPEQRERLKESDKLVEEVLKSDVIVLGCPIIAGHIPTPLRAWVTNLVRPGKTFTRPEVSHRNQTYGLLHDKVVVLLESLGPDARPTDTSEAAEAQLRSILSRLGVRRFERVCYRESFNTIASNPREVLSWAKCETSINEVAARLKKRWNTPLEV